MMKNNIKKLYEEIKKKWIENEIGNKLLVVLIIALASLIVLYCATQLGMVIYENFEFMAIGMIAFIIGVSCFVAWFRWLFPEKESKVETQPVHQRAEKPIYLQQRLVNEFMFSLFQSLSVPLHIKKPDMIPDIMDKVDMYTDNTSNVTYFRYNIIMIGEPIEKNLFEEILRKGIEKRLPTSKLGKPIAECNRKQYSKLMIDEVEFTGASWRVVVVIVDDDYARVLENKAQQHQFIDKQDELTFYDDGDFS